MTKIVLFLFVAFLYIYVISNRHRLNQLKTKGTFAFFQFSFVTAMDNLTLSWDLKRSLMQLPRSSITAKGEWSEALSCFPVALNGCFPFQNPLGIYLLNAFEKLLLWCYCVTYLREYTHDPITLSILTRYLLSYLPDLNILYVASCTQHEISSSSDACIDTFSKVQELYIYVYMGIYYTLYIFVVVFLCSLSPILFN